MKLPVLVALPDSWEAQLVAGLRASTRLEVVRRCVDLADLLAAAAAGQGRVALLSAELRLLERSCVAQLEEQGLIVVGVTAPADEDQERRLRQLGIDVVIGSDASALAVESAVDAARAGRGVNDRLAALMAPGAGTPQWSPTQTFPTQTAPTPATSRQASEPVEPAPDEGAVRYRRIAVWGPAGAPGRSTIALNVAAELARGGVSTLLVDADPYGGTLAAALGLIDEVAGLAAAVRSAEHGLLDLPALSALAPQVLPQLRILTGLPTGHRWIELRPVGLAHVLDVARELATVTVIDCGFSLEDDEDLSYDTQAPRRNGATVTAVDSADLVLVVGSADPIGMQRLVRSLRELRERQLASTRQVVVTKVRASAVGSRPQARLAEALATFADVQQAHLIPDDRAALDGAMLAGRTLAEYAPHSPARQAIAELTRLVVPPAQGDPPQRSGRVRIRRRA